MTTHEVVGKKLILLEMSEDEQSEIMARGDQQSDDRWWLGDKGKRWAQNIKEYSLPCSVMDAYDVIAYLYADNVSGRTIRYYTEIATFYEEWARREYDVLPFSHFELAMRYDRENWQTTLEMSVKYMDAHNGKRPSAKWLEAALSGWLDKKNAEEFRESLPDELEAEMSTLDDMVQYDFMVADAEDERDLDALPLRAVLKVADMLLDKIDRVPVDAELRMELHDALNRFRSVLDRVVRSML